MPNAGRPFAGVASTGGDAQVVDHPSLVPAALVVDDEQAREIGEHVDEGADVVRIGGQVRLGLDDHPHGTDRRQATPHAAPE